MSRSDGDWSPAWAQPSVIQNSEAYRVPRDFLQNVKPLGCHSHNDELRDIPLFEALHSGCTGIEADIWLSPQDSKNGSDLLVGHTAAELKPNKTLQTMYIKPITYMLDQRNPTVATTKARVGLFDQSPEQTLVLLIDFKEERLPTQPIFSLLVQQLEPLRRKRYLTQFDGLNVVIGPVTIVVSGAASIQSVLEMGSDRDIFFDAPLGTLCRDGLKGSRPEDEGGVFYNRTNS